MFSHPSATEAPERNYNSWIKEGFVASSDLSLNAPDDATSGSRAGPVGPVLQARMVVISLSLRSKDCFARQACVRVMCITSSVCSFAQLKKNQNLRAPLSRFARMALLLAKEAARRSVQ